MAVSEDLRIRLVRKVASGMSRRQAAALFEVSASSALRYVRRYEDEGTVAVKPRPSRKRRLDPYGEDILRWIKETPDLTLQELSERLDEVHEVIAPTSTINDWFRARKISFKKKPHTPVNRNARMCRQHAWFGANVRPGSWPIPSGSAGSCSLTKQVSIPKWRACGGAVPEASGWLPPFPMVIGKP